MRHILLSRAGNLLAVSRNPRFKLFVQIKRHTISLAVVACCLLALPQSASAGIDFRHKTLIQLENRSRVVLDLVCQYTKATSRSCCADDGSGFETGRFKWHLPPPRLNPGDSVIIKATGWTTDGLSTSLFYQDMRDPGRTFFSLDTHDMPIAIVRPLAVGAIKVSPEQFIAASTIKGRTLRVKVVILDRI